MAKITTNTSEAVERLKAGDVVALPTETVYGLAGSVFSPTAIEKIFKIKERPFFDPLIVHIGNIYQITEVVDFWPKSAQELAERFWPGPLTMVLPKKKSIDDKITAGLPNVGIRYPDHVLASEVIREVGAPLAAPSANKFKKVSPTSAEHVCSEFPDEDLLVLEGGTCNIGLESTVIGINETDTLVQIEIYRPGFITESQILEALSKTKPIEIVHKTNPAAPGQMDEHYMPSLPLVVYKNRIEPTDVDFHITQNLVHEKLTRPIELTLDANPVLAARELYSKLRKCSEQPGDHIRIYYDEYPVTELWSSIWDRLNRAATFKFN